MDEEMNNHIAIGSIVEIRCFVQDGALVKESWLTCIVKDVDEDKFLAERVNRTFFPGGEALKWLRKSDFRSHWR